MEDLRKALGILRKNKLYVKFSKCNFCIKQVLLLSHIIFKGSVAVDSSKVGAVMKQNQLKISMKSKAS